MDINGRPVSAETALSLPLTSGGQPLPKAQTTKRIPPAIKKLVAEVGLRYRPTSQADLEAHAAQLALLAADLADMPPKLLERAISQHVTSSPYMPKAADLIDIAKTMLPGALASETLEEKVERHNRDAIDRGSFIRWYIDGGRLAHCDVSELAGKRAAAGA